MMAKKTLIEEKWEDEEPQVSKPSRIVSNFYNGEWIDRIYGGDNLKVRLSQGEFGKEYQGKIEQKKFRRYRKDMNGKAIGVYYQRYSHTADGRWFDNTGFPIEVPTKLEPEKQPDPEELELEKQRKLQHAKAKEAAILANLK